MNGFAPTLGHWLTVAGGGALGAMLRFWVATQLLPVNAFPAWPWGTFTVNMAGSLLFGFLAVWLAGNAALNEHLRYLLMMGLLGSFTTYSTFSFEVVRLLDGGAWTLAAGYGVTTLAGCVAFAGFGLWVARILLN